MDPLQSNILLKGTFMNSVIIMSVVKLKTSLPTCENLTTIMNAME